MKRLPSLFLTLLLSATPTSAQSWSVRSHASEGSSSTDGYFGFPFSLHQNTIDMTTYNSNICYYPNSCDPSYCSSIGIDTGGYIYAGDFFAASSSNWDFQNHTVGKVLTRGFNSFRNPSDGNLYKFLMYFASQSIDLCSDHTGWGTAYSYNGANNWVEGSQLPALADCSWPSPCYTNWYCEHGWPCDNHYPKQWWTTAEMVAPFYSAAPFYSTPAGTFLAPFMSFIAPGAPPCNPDPCLPPESYFADCSHDNSLCFPGNPAQGGTLAYVLQSTDGYTWSNWVGPNGEKKFSSSGIDATSPCYHAAWLINLDVAYDVSADDFYMTRSYASNFYQGADCTPISLPDHVQLYKTHSASGLFHGTWTLLFDGGCSNLGFQPDSASILHDGMGGVVFGDGGTITLMIGASNGAACSQSPYPRHRVVVGPPATVISVNPNSGSSAGGTPITVTGTSFAAGATVTLGGTPATGVTTVNSTTITATTGAHAPCAVNVVVTNPGSQGGTLTNGYTYLNGTSPAVCSISPKSGPPAGGTPITVTGNNFVAGATLTLGGVSATGVTVVNSTTITATTPAHALGKVSVVVTNPNAQNGTLTNGYQYK
jgi:hypothetical protein